MAYASSVNSVNLLIWWNNYALFRWGSSLGFRERIYNLSLFRHWYMKWPTLWISNDPHRISKILNQPECEVCVFVPYLQSAELWRLYWTSVAFQKVHTSSNECYTVSEPRNHQNPSASERKRETERLDIIKNKVVSNRIMITITQHSICLY